jgi:formate dehydrogenase subunit delta
MSEGAHTPGSAEHLVAMANDIGNYFRSQPRNDAVAGIATHIKRYWTPRMREKLNAYLAKGNAGLDELPRAAIDELNRQSKSAASPGHSVARP